jgi:hypothetical protein
MTFDAEGRLQVLNARRSGTIPWLLQHSYLYRYYVGRTLAAPAIGEVDESLFEVVEKQFAEMRDLTRARGATLSVLVIPWMRDPAEWTPLVRGNYDRTLALLARLGIHAYDALPSLEESVAAGEALGEPEGDLMHPGVPLSDRFAALLQREGFLASAE